MVTLSKTLFNVLLPATGRRYDFWIPDDMQMQVVSELVAEAMQVAEPNFFRATSDSVLMYVETGEVQNPNATVSEIGFADGDQFVLV